MSNSIQKYIRENISIILKILFIYFIGVAVGIIIFIFTDIKTEYINIVSGVFEGVKSDNFEGINVIANGIKNNIIYIGILYFSLITIIAPLIICFFVFLKAIVTGIYLCTLYSDFGVFNGILVTLISVIIPNIFSLIGYIIICTNVINLFKLISQGEKVDIKQVLKHLYFLLISISLISFSIVLEQLMTGVSLKIYTNIF